MPAGNWNLFSILERHRGLLERVNATSRKLHDPKRDLRAAVAMVVSLKSLSRPNVKPSPSTNDMEQLYLAHQTTCRLASVHAMFASTMVRRRMLNSLLLRSFARCHQLHSGNRPVCHVTCSPPICVRGTMLQMRFPWET